MADEHHDDHGQTPAAWTAVFIIMAGFLIGSIAVVAASPLWAWIGVAVVIIGAIAGKVMQMMGMGKKPVEPAS